MDQRTCNIIMCCKGFGKGQGAKEKIINYIAKECALPEAKLDDERLIYILYAACVDFMNNCSKSGSQEFFQALYLSKGNGFIDHAIAAFCQIDVKDANGYINGFSEELITNSKIILSGLQHDTYIV